MVECATQGCTRTAEHTVTFENPDEQVVYCSPCARANYDSNQRAVRVEKEVDDAE